MEEVVGTVERITYQSEVNGYTVAKLQEPRRRELTCVVGTMPTVRPGETIRCRGEWKTHMVHGKQFEVDAYSTEAPADILGIRKYLGSGLVKGIGPIYADRIVERFGVDTLNVIDADPNRLLEINGIGKKKVDQVRKCWAEQRTIREVMVFLQSYGVSPTFAQKIFKNYGELSIDKVKTNPYCLAKDIFGIGFKSADKVASKMGISKESSERLAAGIEFTLSELSNDGHVCYPVDDFVTKAAALLEVEQPLIEPLFDQLQNEKRITLESINDCTYIWIRPLNLAEKGIAREIKRLQRAPCTLRDVDTKRAVDWVQDQLRINLADNQKDAVAQAMTEKLQIITGGPGTGKSTITKAILAITQTLSDRILLAAPTGRAAKRMTEITYRKASTIHSLLDYNFQIGGFKRNRQSPLECDLLIIDEASMIDTFLMYHLLRAIPDHARVIFVGDINQLPSVGPGNVLKDLIESERIAVTMLTEIFRQARGSQIITNAHKINSGEFPFLTNRADSDFFFLEEQDPEQLLNTIVELVSKRLPNKYRFNPITDIQVLAPMRRGVVGTINLNVMLQKALNPNRDPLHRGGQCFLKDDKVMQLRNNYQKEVYNGDVGQVQKIDLVEQEMTINFDGRNIVYGFSELDEVTLAYAVSIHKYQGSECPCIVMPIHTTHFKLLHRNLLYTGVTRGKKLVVLVGTKKAIAIAVHNDEVRKRHTSLTHQINPEK